METYGIEKLGIIGPKAVYRNLSPAQLVEAALRRGEGTLPPYILRMAAAAESSCAGAREKGTLHTLLPRTAYTLSRRAVYHTPCQHT